MNDRFDELAKAMAQSVTRRAALKRFSVGLGAFALAALGLANNTHAAYGVKAGGVGAPCRTEFDCKKGLVCHPVGLRLVGTCAHPGGVGT